MNISHRLILPVAALVASATFASAQDQNNQPRQRGGDRGGFSMEEFRKRMEERMKGAMKVSDEEWAVLQPLIEKVQTKGREVMSARFGGGGPGGPGGPGGDRGRGDRGPGGQGGGTPPAAGTPPAGGGDRGGDRGRPEGGDRGGSPEAQALRTALESDATSPDDIKAKLTALRESRKKATAELEAARADLQKVVTVRQEAVLVAMGVLD